MKKTTLTIITILTAFLINAQTTITGTVSDYTRPLPFANVTIEGTDSGTVADAKGHFSIKTNKGDILTISYVGFMPKHITIENTKHLEVSLDMESLDEVVIIEYGIYHHKNHTICLAPPERTSLSAQRIIGNTLDANRIPIYPNPSSSGYFNINLLDNYQNIDISVSAITGQTILTRSFSHPNQTINIDLSRFATGIYIVNITSNEKVIATQKVIRS